MSEAAFREAIRVRIEREARPVDKFGHQPRLYALARRVGAGHEFDDDVVFATVWLHDLGVFVGHRPEDPEQLARWDNTSYAAAQAPRILKECGFPEAKIPAVVDAILTHQPAADPATIEGIIVRDADILEQLGAIAILRTVSKIGRDTRFSVFTDAVKSLRRSLETLPSQIRLDTTRALAAPKIRALEAFLAATEEEARPALY
ncbi:MAG TPA: HD domain-containing protein [Bryobacteraceae bacterium]|nr:HD domain-containing protein [Bryobacteraceae bacterium]